MTTALLIWLALIQQDVLIIPSTEQLNIVDAYVEMGPPVSEEEAMGIQLAIMDDLILRGHNEVTGVNLLGRGHHGRWVSFRTFFPPVEPVRQKPWELKSNGAGSPVLTGVNAPGKVSGFLNGKTVYLSQGHGFYWSTVLGRWATQRGNTHGIVEDLVGAEGINHYLIPLLLNAGATVFPMREFDMNEDREVVDQSQAQLTGDWSDGPAGYDPSKTVLQSGQNPFEGGHTLIANAGPEVTATARFEFDLEGSRKYALYASWSAAPDRVPDVHFRVHHGNTVTEIRADQRRHGKTWMYLGHFPASLTHVEVTNQSDHVGTVSIDAIRAGGGLGLIERGNGAPPAAAPTSMRPRWEECSRYTAQYQGAPTSVYNSSSGGDHKDDVGNRARYAAWQHEEGEDAVFVSWHSNAPDGGTGTSSYVYGPNSPDGSYNFTGTQGSDALATNVHNSIVNAIQDEWDPNWKDRGIRSAWFGELNPKSNPEMPSVLVETAFHATEYDANYLAEPRFRFTLARAYYHGIVDYFAARDDQPPVYVPEAPMHFRILSSGEGSVTFSWESSPEGQPATGYRLWTTLAPDGQPIATTENTVTLDGAMDQSFEAYVTATNAGGESFPSATLSAWTGCEGKEQRVLLVQGFTRLDRFNLPVDDLSSWGLGQVLRLDQHVVNTFDYARVHGAALLANNISFDAVEATAIESGLVDLKGYAMIDWILGEESTVDETFTDKEQSLLAAYLDDGGRLFVSGAEILWDLDEKGSESDKAFAATYLKSKLSADSAETYTLNTGASFNKLYDVAFADVLEPVGDADALWHYDNGGVAAVVHSGDFSVVTAGFPFETVAPFSEQSIEMMNEIMEVLGVGPWHQGGQCEEVQQDPGPETQIQVEPAPRHDAGSTAQVIGVGFIVERRTTSCALAHRPSPITGPVLLLLLVLVLAYRRKGKRLFAAWQK